MKSVLIGAWLAAALLLAGWAGVEAAPPLAMEDIFALEYAEDPRISPDGRSVAYVRRNMDRMSDRVGGSLWTIDAAGGILAPLAPVIGRQRAHADHADDGGGRSPHADHGE